MDYNSTREKLVLPEYGRTVQNMIKHAVGIADREERNRCARTIVNIMANMFPQQKDTQDFRHKLWDQMAIISEYKLDVDAPFELPDKSELERHPDTVPYVNNHIRLKHYGHVVEDMIEAAVEMEDPIQKRHLVVNIANYMKNSLLAWNKDFATDERLFNDIAMLSGGRLQVEDGVKTAEYHRDHLNNVTSNRSFKKNTKAKKQNNRGRNSRSNRNY